MKMINFDIFRAYDVRGIYPSEVNEKTFYTIAKGYASVFKPREIAVGMDARLSSPPLKEGLVKGFLDVGVNVIDLGQITTDMLYFAVGAYNYSGGIIVSASHNPKQYNGLKMVREKATAISSDTGLYDIRDALKLGKDKQIMSASKGIYKKKAILADYVKHVLSFINPYYMQKLTFVGNANFGFVSRPIKMIIDCLKLNLVQLNFEPDGSFPKGPPDPLLPDNRTETEKLIRKSGADFGIAWDGDADRVMFFDENGRFIPGTYITALLAKIMLEKFGEKNNRIIFDPRIIWPILNVVKEMGGHPIISKAGHTFMKDRMRLEDALFAGELSGHYYFHDNFYADNGIIPFLLILEHISIEGEKLSEIIAPLQEGHYMSEELNYKVSSPDQIIKKIRQHFKAEGTEDFTDGYSVETETWRFNIRLSHTEPLLRLNVEAMDENIIGRIIQEVEEIIKG